MHTLVTIDITIFNFLNQTLANPLLDLIMPVVTNLNYWRVPIVLVWLYLIIKGGRKGRVVAILLIPVLIMSDQVSSSLLKPLFGRIRPCYELENVRLLVGCGGKLAFPSSHATNISAVAFLFAYFYRKGTLWFAFTALMVGYSRIYVGVHYPGDVLFGFFVGCSTSGLLIFLYLEIAKRFPAVGYVRENPPENS